MVLDEPTRGGFFMQEMLGLSGLEQMKAGIEGRAVPPPMHHLTGVRPTEIGPDGREITARSSVIHAGRHLALSEAAVVDGDGREIAHATSRCFIFPGMDSPPAPPADLPVLDPVDYGSPDPYRRHPEGNSAPAPAPMATAATTSGAGMWTATSTRRRSST